MIEFLKTNTEIFREMRDKEAYEAGLFNKVSVPALESPGQT